MKNPHFSRIKKIACLVCMRISITETKFAERAIRTVLVGYLQTGYVFVHPDSGRFLNSRHIKLNERVVYKNAYKKNPRDVIKELEGCNNHNDLADEYRLTKLDLNEKPKRGRPTKHKAQNLNSNLEVK